MNLRESTVPPNDEEQLIHQRALASYEILDAQSRVARAGRSVWISRQQSKVQMMWNAAETAQITNDARDCYIQGNFLAVIVLALAYVEHTLTDALPLQLTKQGAIKPRMLVDAIAIAKAQKLFPEALLDSAATLANHRNPYVHRRPAVDADALRVRNPTPQVVSKTATEQDAQEAIQVIYGFLRIRLHGTVNGATP